MGNHKLTKYYFILFLSFNSIGITFAQDFFANGDYTINIENEITEAGNDYIGTYTSNANATNLSITGASGLSWSVSISFTTLIEWDNAFVIQVIRTGTGTGTGTVNGGDTYQIVSAVDTLFFTGQSNLDSIPIQYLLSNISVVSPVKDYRASLVYTFVSP